MTSTAALPIVVERTMRWDATRYGAHTEKATDGPAKTWYFAEGSQGFFVTYRAARESGADRRTRATVHVAVARTAAGRATTFPLAPTSRLDV